MKIIKFTTIILIIVCNFTYLFASNNQVKVINKTTVSVNDNKFDTYIVQTICKDYYQYTVVIKGSSISIIQDSDIFNVIKCKM